MGLAAERSIGRGMWPARGSAAGCGRSVLAARVMRRTCKSTFVGRRLGAGVEAPLDAREFVEATVGAALGDLMGRCRVPTMVDSTSQVLLRNPRGRSLHEEGRGSRSGSRN